MSKNCSKMNVGQYFFLASKRKEKQQRGVSEHFEQIFVELDHSFEYWMTIFF